MAQVKDIFYFLKDFNELSNPVITEIRGQKWNYRISNIPDIKEVWCIYDVQDFGSLKILEVRRPDLKPCPYPDENLKEWILGDWRDLDNSFVGKREAVTKEKRSKEGNTEEETIRFDDDIDRVKAFENWVEIRNKWRENEIPKKWDLNFTMGFTIYILKSKKRRKALNLY